MITKAVHKSSEEEKKEEEVKKTLEQHDNIVTQYKELIREQVHAAKTCPLVFQSGNMRTDHFIVAVQSSGCSDPGAERTIVIHDVSEGTNAGDYDSAAIADTAAQRSVQHPQVEIRWVMQLWVKKTKNTFRLVLIIRIIIFKSKPQMSFIFL